MKNKECEIIFRQSLRLYAEEITVLPAKIAGQPGVAD